MPLQPISWDDLDKPVDMSDNLLGNRFLERGQGAVLFGPAGCGKSVAALQACCDWAAGRAGLSIHPERPLKIVVVQTEDSINDQREALAGILKVYNQEESTTIKQNLIVLPQQPGGDATKLTSQLTQIGEQYQPDLVLLNPLSAFCKDPVKELGTLLYNGIDPILKKYKMALLAVHHTPKMNGKDTRDYGAHDHQYLAAGDSRVANWPRGMIQIEPVGKHGVYIFRAVKRGGRTGWKSMLLDEPTTELYLRWGTDGIRWEEAAAPDIQKAKAQRDYRELLRILPQAHETGISRERVILKAKNDLQIGKSHAEAWLKLCVEEELVERVEVLTASNRKGAVFRRAGSGA